MLTTLESRPFRNILAFLVAATVIAWPLFRVQELYGVALLLFALPLILLFIPLRVHQGVRLFAGYAFVAGMVAFALNTDVLAGPDEVRYFAQVERFQSVGGFFAHVYAVLREHWVLGTAYLSFPVLYLPYYGTLGLQQPESIVALNVLFWLLTVGLAAWMFQRWWPEHLESAPVAGFFVLASFSPAAMYFTSIFAKDAGATLLAVLAALCVLRGRWVAAIPLLYFGTMLRPYTIAIAGAYVLLSRASTRGLLLAAAGAVGVVFVVTGLRTDALINVALLSGFMFLSPQPLNPDNWVGYLTPLALEGVFLGGLAAISLLVMLFSPTTRPLYCRTFSAVIIYAAVLVLVGYVHIRALGLSYGVGTAGDNMLRKKLPLVPVFYLHAAVTLRALFNALLPKRAYMETPKLLTREVT